MNKILLIIQREYLSRVKKKSFIIMTLLTPLIVAGFYGLIIYFSIQGVKGTFNKVAVVNNNKSLTEKLQPTKNIGYAYVNQSLEAMKSSLKTTEYDYILYLPEFDISSPKGIQLIGTKQAGLSLSNRVSGDIEELIRTQKLKASGISQTDLDGLKTDVNIDTKKIGEAGKEEDSSAGASTIIGTAAGIFMFMFILLYGIQVMRGVIEEKTSRIIEIMISSVKPFQLMMGKIIGIALVGLTQFVLWIVLTASISTLAVSAFVGKDAIAQNTSVAIKAKDGTSISPAVNSPVDSPVLAMQKSLASLDLTKIILVFIFFFIGGYLFYSALYAAIGSAVDSETETQQFMMPVMMPLLVGYALSLSVVTNDPYGPIAFWLSMIPFTSPIAMVVRLPYGVPDWQLALSMLILVVGFIGTVWLASRIYRVGILMYGKKTSLKEMIKWFTYKN
ncbi:ABC-2 type transport system permease protein [Pedobacter steynii]|uniref:ABC-2 type transport system permease protein n=1 Tax=Pedobacter steynii TaxID=430522 RepID=A0A1G9YW34_9SPHI|nr:ABC transporter permease [Pedobacter steynii]NQX39856.1 ABC transporter permease [Pedobacter steynii]SDN13334.1 ABC-2 type transport system permease protein [Pedobacter steynii]